MKTYPGKVVFLKICFPNVSASLMNFCSTASMKTYPGKVVYLKICFTNVSVSLMNFCSAASVKPIYLKICFTNVSVRLMNFCSAASVKAIPVKWSILRLASQTCLSVCFTNLSVRWKNFCSAASVKTYPSKVVYLKTCFTNVSASLKNFCSGASVNASALVGVLLAALLGLVCLDPAGEGGRPRRTKWRNRPPRKFPLKWKKKKTTRQRHKKYNGGVAQSVIKSTQD